MTKIDQKLTTKINVKIWSQNDVKNQWYILNLSRPNCSGKLFATQFIRRDVFNNSRPNFTAIPFL
jgi:hypothetical protein